MLVKKIVIIASIRLRRKKAPKRIRIMKKMIIKSLKTIWTLDIILVHPSSETT